MLNATTFLTFVSKQACTRFSAPITFVLINSMGLYSAAGTCFKAAACTTVSIRLSAVFSRSLSLISPRKISNLDIFFLRNAL